MKVGKLRELLVELRDEDEIAIQLPDHYPPVDFYLEDFGPDQWGQLLVLFPLPPAENSTWCRDTNVIEYEERKE